MKRPSRAPRAAARPSLWLCLRRGLRLRCPECGLFPIFVSPGRVRSLDHWLHPLDGCPRCGYAYEREPGYFLLAIWGINYGVVGGLGVAAALVADSLLGLSTLQVLLFVIAPLPLVSLLFARHAKALFLALDHWLDPQGR